jgi:hypothetical protein
MVSGATCPPRSLLCDLDGNSLSRVALKFRSAASLNLPLVYFAYSLPNVGKFVQRITASPT